MAATKDGSVSAPEASAGVRLCAPSGARDIVEMVCTQGYDVDVGSMALRWERRTAIASEPRTRAGGWEKKTTEVDADEQQLKALRSAACKSAAADSSHSPWPVSARACAAREGERRAASGPAAVGVRAAGAVGVVAV